MSAVMFSGGISAYAARWRAWCNARPCQSERLEDTREAYKLLKVSYCIATYKVHTEKWLAQSSETSGGEGDVHKITLSSGF